MPDPINEALMIYTAYGQSPFPRARTPGLVARFGAEAAEALKARILALLAELREPVEMPETKGRKSATELALAALRPCHPELDETGLKALAWTFGFGLR